MAGPRTPISCGSGYIVQLASDTTEAGLRSRIPDLLAADHVPAGSAWTLIQGSCAMWSISSGAVLYAGPFLSPYDACDARLHGPSDAFIKVADPANFKNFYTCACPATSASLPQLTTLGQQSVWVGDLQRALVKLGHKIPDLDGSGGAPVAWGVYSAGTAAAVREFQTDAFLPVTGTVDEETWDQLKAYVC